MKKIKKRWILLGISAVVLIFVIIGTIFYNNTKVDPKSEEADLASYLIEQDNIMSALTTNMQFTPTSSADLDFLYGMIPHYQASIQMSKSYLAYGGANGKLRRIAKDIIHDQTEDVKEMQALASRLENTALSDTAVEETYLNSYNEILSEHQYFKHGTDTNQTVELAYVEGMTAHHTMAVDMAKTILTTSINDDIRDCAEDVLELQQDEISQLRATVYSQQDPSFAGH